MDRNYQLDLPAAAMTEFRLEIDPGPATEELFSLLAPTLEQLKPRRFFKEQYERSGTVHDLLILLPNEGAREAIYFLYDLEPTTTKYDDAEAVIEALCELKIDVEAECTAEFDFPNDTYVSIIPLPVELDNPALPMDRVLGYRFVKDAAGDDAGSLYSVVIDVETPGRTSVNVSFRHAARLESPDIFAGAYARAIQIASYFVRAKAT